MKTSCHTNTDAETIIICTEKNIPQSHATDERTIGNISKNLFLLSCTGWMQEYCVCFSPKTNMTFFSYSMKAKTSILVCKSYFKILHIRTTDRSEQTVQAKIRQLLTEQSVQGLNC